MQAFGKTKLAVLIQLCKFFVYDHHSLQFKQKLVEAL